MIISRTSLYEEHKLLNAKMAPFAGFEMPIQYTSVKEEVFAVREGVGIFDVSHMGEFFISGPDAIRFADYLITNDFLSAEIGKAVYSPLCREDGTVIDDLIMYKISDTSVLVCVNASNIEKDWEWFKKHKGEFNCSLENNSNHYSLIAIQGPKTLQVLKAIFQLAFESIPVYGVKTFEAQGDQYIFARTGYTGEDGFEVFANHQAIIKLWKKLLLLNAVPCGLAARDVLRLEVCFPLYGHELTDELNPYDANLGWTVKLKKDQFVGKETLLKKNFRFKTVKLILEKAVPRQGYSLLNSKNEKIGVISSGTHSVILGQGIALAHVEKDLYPKDENFFIQIRDKVFQAILTEKPFVQKK